MDSRISRSPRQTRAAAGSSRSGADRDDHWPLSRVATRQGTQPGQQLAEGEWLGEVVVGARVEPANPIIDRRARGEHDDRRPVTGAAKLATGRESVRVRQHDVEHNDVVRRVGKHGAGPT